MIFLIKKEGKSCIMKKMRYICEQIKNTYMQKGFVHTELHHHHHRSRIR